LPDEKRREPNAVRAGRQIRRSSVRHQVSVPSSASR
jgi:hypothetical protein